MPSFKQQRQAQQEQTPAQEQPQAAEQPAPDSVFFQAAPEQQQEMADSVKAMLQTLIDADVKSTGEVTQRHVGRYSDTGLCPFRRRDAATGRGPAKTPEPQAEEPPLDPAAGAGLTILFSESPIWKPASKCRCMRPTPSF